MLGFRYDHVKCNNFIECNVNVLKPHSLTVIYFIISGFALFRPKSHLFFGFVPPNTGGMKSLLGREYEMKNGKPTDLLKKSGPLFCQAKRRGCLLKNNNVPLWCWVPAVMISGGGRRLVWWNWLLRQFDIEHWGERPPPKNEQLLISTWACTENY